MLGIFDTGYDICQIINRIKNEAEDTEQMATMINAEIYAYHYFRDMFNPHCVVMYDTPKTIDDYNIVGEFWETEEDMEDTATGYIVIKDSMRNGKYYVSYYKQYKMEV
jgi:diaminopimelate epimerase